MSYLIDDTGTLDLAAARAASDAGAFVPVAPGANHNQGFTPATIWLKADVALPPDSGMAWYLVLPYPPLDHIRAHLLTDGAAGQGVDIDIGIDIGEDAADRRPVAHRFAVLPLPADQPRVVVYLEIRSEGSVQLPLQLMSAEAFAAATATDNVFYAAYFAALMTMLLYNGFLWLTIRERGYLLYVTYLAAFGLLQVLITGYGAMLWADMAVQWGNPLLLLLLGLSEAIGVLFVASFLDTRMLLPLWHGLLTILAWVCLATGALGLVLPYSLTLKLLLGLAAIVLVALPAAIVTALRAGRRSARFLVLAIAVLAPGCTAAVLRTLGLLPTNFLTLHLLEFSTALEMIVLSFALADRFNVLQAEQRQAEQALQASAREHAERLVRTLEEERRRVARELHDSIGQNLLVIGNQLGRIGGKIDASELKRPLGEVADLAKQTVQDVRAIAHRLYPQQLARLGLRDALAASLAQAFDASETALHLSLPPALPPLAGEASVHLFHIVQEAASNVLRHADADNCWIGATTTANGLEFMIADDGRGGAVAPHEGGAGMGLVGQRERAMILGGAIQIVERPDGGTLVTLTLPLGERG